MPVEQGIVKETNNHRATVRVERSSACEHCSARGTCGIDLGSDKEIFIEVENRLNAKAGDRVELSMPAGSLIKMAIMVYILPIFSLIFGAYEGGNMASHIGISSGIGSIIGALILLIISFFVLRKIDRYIKQKDSYKVKMIRILPN